jgi:hypothetical protein
MFSGDLPPAEAVSSLGRMRQSMSDTLFEISQGYPKLLALRSTPSAWTAFRILMGAAGAGLVVLPLSLWNAWAFAPVGLVLFLLAVLLPPIRQDRGTQKAVQQLGAYSVLDGGRFFGATENEAGVPAGPADVNFYLTKSRVWALDADLRPVVVIPANEVRMVAAFPQADDWTLRVSWKSGAAEFVFTGIFAERRARLAEEGMLHLIGAPEPAPARARAATAG